MISGRGDPDVRLISYCPAIKEGARKRAAAGSAFGRSTQGAKASWRWQLLPSRPQKTFACRPEKNRRCPKSKVGKSEETESRLKSHQAACPELRSALRNSTTQKSRVRHHTVHLSVMDGTVRMTASQSQARSKRMHRTAAFCSVPEIKINSTCKPEKRKALVGRGNERFTLRRLSAAGLLTSDPLALRSGVVRSRASARRRDLLNFASLASILSGFPSRVPIPRLFSVDWARVGGTTDNTQCCSPPLSQV